jgi:2-methylisocitrate lyase-like PEP mutase family enzyme
VNATLDLRSMVADGDAHLVLGVYDAMTARIGESAGFEILYLTGFGVAATLVGVPDIGLVTMSETVDVCRRICDVVTRPVIADADTGYGNALSVRRTVRAFEAAGAAGLHLEDQVAPKRCGHMPGKQVISRQEMVGKLGAALDARRDDNFCIIARTDARSVEGIDAAIDRAHTYRAAGADILFIEAPQSVAEMEQIAAELDCPLVFNWSYDGVTPHVSRKWLAGIGYKLILFPDIAFAAHRALAAFTSQLADSDSLDSLAEKMTGFEEFNDFVGLRDWRRIEAQYLDGTGQPPPRRQEVR